jgi:hypothetical protein
VHQATNIRKNGNPPMRCRHRPAKKSPAFAGLFSLTTYLLSPEPGPVGANVDPLGEGLAPTVLPDGFLEL